MESIQAIPYPLLVGAVFCFGLAIGSFANVCIYRLPRKESVAFPGSHCPGCSSAVRPLDNIPLISYIVLGGKSYHPKTPDKEVPGQSIIKEQPAPPAFFHIIFKK